MSTHQIHVFISHAWSHSHHYETLESWIFGESWSSGQASLDFRNFSIPKDDPIHNAHNTSALLDAIANQIKRSHVIVIPTGMYAAYSKWIQREIECSKYYNRGILAVDPWAQERSADVVVSNSDIRVGWNKQPVINAIWDLYRSAK